ncbi:MAG: imidazole glycerol phosphate synthase subunit HisH [Bdellovibrio sp.]
MIAIVNYEIGNIGSLTNAFKYLGESLEVVSEPHILDQYDAIVLPGVGAFDTAMSALHKKGFVDSIRNFAQSGKAIMGICLGLQVLCNNSEEGALQGLGLVDASIRSLRTLGCIGKVPHVGFNEVKKVEGSSKFLVNALGKDFYFVHSYALAQINDKGENVSLAHSEYEGVKFISAFQCKNIFAAQFHPEKSGEAGINLISEFISCSKSV